MEETKNGALTQEQEQAREQAIADLNKKIDNALKNTDARLKFCVEDFDKATAEDGAKNICGGFGSIKKRTPIISLNGVPIAYMGDIVGIKGQPKTGKSQFAALLMAACIAERPIGGKVYIKNGLSMIVFDTEQSDESATLRYNCALRTAGSDNSFAGIGKAGYTMIREFNYKERREILTRRVEAFNPDIIYIDGIRQLMADFNDSKESGEIIDFLKILANDGKRIVIVVLHTNPTDASTDDAKKMRGHIGTELANAALSVISLTSKQDGDNYIFRAATSLSRDTKPTQVCFKIVGPEDDSRFVILQDPEQEEKERIFTDVFRELERTKEPATRPALVKVLLETDNPKTGKPFKSTAAYDLVDRATKILHVLEFHDGLYYLAHHA